MYVNVCVYMSVCESVCVHVHAPHVTCRCRRPEEVSDALQLKFQAVLSCLTWATGTRPWSSSVFNCWAIHLSTLLKSFISVCVRERLEGHVWRSWDNYSFSCLPLSGIQRRSSGCRVPQRLRATKPPHWPCYRYPIGLPFALYTSCTSIISLSPFTNEPIKHTAFWSFTLVFLHATKETVKAMDVTYPSDLLCQHN